MITCWIDRLNAHRVSSALASMVGKGGDSQLRGDNNNFLPGRKINFKKNFCSKIKDREVGKIRFTRKFIPAKLKYITVYFSR